MTGAVARRLLAEVIGTGLLVAVVAGSGIAATRLTTDGALRLLVNSVVTALGLAVQLAFSTVTWLVCSLPASLSPARRARTQPRHPPGKPFRQAGTDAAAAR